MAYDRYDREERDHRWSDHRDHRGEHPRERSHRDDERSWFERAGDEISSWFGGSDRDPRDHRDDHRHHPQERGLWGSREEHSHHDRDRHAMPYGSRDDGRRHRDDNRGPFATGGSSERDYNPDWRREHGEGDRGRGDYRSGYRPMAGDYGRSGDRRDDHADSEQFFAASGIPPRGPGRGESDRSSYQRSQSPWGRDEYRRSSFAGSSERSAPRDPARGGNRDPHYDQWRERHMSDIDREYDDYRRERQSRFEDDFSGWRQKRSEKRSLLGRVREHMDVVGNDGRHVGTVDKAAGDRLILTKSDPESGGRHHSISCSDIDRIEDNRVILDCSADQARERWRDEDRSRALFERHDRGEDGPHILNRSFEGTYRR